jgi:competence protein CoiA
MQLYALDSEEQIVTAALAAKGKTYLCPECRSPLRVRSGARRQPHFFHLSHNRQCRQSGKSLTHLKVQQRLFDLLPAGEAVIECRFAAINRIADIAWIPQRLIFEVQCSPITAEEVDSRNRDYQSEGFQTVWILHDRRFKRYRASAAENLLTTSPCYFTNIDSRGEGMIYDQCAPIAKGIRKNHSMPLPVNIARPLPVPEQKTPYPYINNRQATWPLCFQGDLITRYHESPSAWKFLEKAGTASSLRPDSQILRRFIVDPYLSVLHLLLKNLAL